MILPRYVNNLTTGPLHRVLLLTGSRVLTAVFFKYGRRSEASMAKSLGQIHTVNQEMAIAQGTAPEVIGQIDLPGQLTGTLQQMVRQGNFFKVVGIDMTVDDNKITPSDDGGQITGEIRYWAPTKQRCAAYRSAFKATRTAMKLQGIVTHTNEQYDFRVPFSDSASYAMPNQANLSGGTDGLCFDNPNGNSPDSCSVFGVYNQSVQPTELAAPTDLFQTGFNTMGLQADPTDFVLNDEALWSGNDDLASTTWQSIPFQLVWSPGSTDISVSFNWRPDPALYLAILGGVMEVYVYDADFDDGSSSLLINIAVHVSGWKSIMGDPKNKKKKSRRRSSRRRKK